MKLSIIIPVYNGEESISKCVNSLLNQEVYKPLQDYEIIVINDGSTDKTSQILNTLSNITQSNERNNRGRVYARKKGAELAKSDLLLFIDSRVIASRNLVKKCIDLQRSSPIIAGDLGDRKSKYNSVFNTLFFLFRRAYYGKNSYAKNVDIIINKTTFSKTPKGTTCLLINKDVFFKSIPEKFDITTNDDTKIFENIVFTQNQSILRSPEIKVEYLQRNTFKKVIPWIFERGIRFSDYYLKPDKYLLYLYIATLLIIFVLVLLSLPLLIITGFITLILISVYLAENIYDFFVVLFFSPVLIITFVAGNIKYFIYRITINEK